MRYTIDRIEGDIAVCETENGNINIYLSELPNGVKSGDVLRKTENGYIIDSNETESARNKNISLLNKLKNKNKK